MPASSSTRLAALGLGVAALLLGGCSGSSSQPGVGGPGSVSDPAAVAGQSREDSGDESGQGPADRQASRGQDSRPGASSASSDIAATDLTERRLIRTGTMTVRTSSVADAADQAADLLDGGDGYVASTRKHADAKGKATSVRLVLRVPVEDYNRVVTAIRELGKVAADDHKTKDVTDDLVDVESRIASQESSIQRLRTLMSHAETVGEVIQVESELAGREAELEALQSRQAALAGQAALSTLTVTFEKPTEADTPPAEPGNGFLAGLGAGWSALVTSAQVALTIIGAVLPFLVALGVLAAAPVWIWLRVRARRRADGVSEQPQPAATG